MIVANPKNCLNITHTGDFYAQRTPKYFIQALKEMTDENKISAADLKVNFVGKISEEDKRLIGQLGLDRIVKCIGRVSHKESIQWMLNSDALLLVSSTEGSMVTGKLYEYLAAKKPILAPAGKGELTDILDRSGVATLASPTDISEIQAAIHRLYLRNISGELEVQPNLSFLKEFERKRLTKQLAKLFDKCLNRDV